MQDFSLARRTMVDNQLRPQGVTDRDARGARIQLSELPIVARVNARRVAAGDDVRVRLIEADPVRRSLRESLQGAAYASGDFRQVEARAGIEPACKDLQSSA